MAKPVVFDPLFSPGQNIAAPVAVTAAAMLASEGHDSQITPMLTLVAASEPPPLSPVSGEPMELLEVGSYGKAPILVWAHLGDRITIPVRGT